MVTRKKEYEAPSEVPGSSKSSIANWLVKIGVVKSPKAGEVATFFIILIIFAAAIVFFSYGVGENKLKDLEEGQSQYLK